MINTLLHKDASQLVGQILREALTKKMRLAVFSGQIQAPQWPGAQNL